MSSPDPIIPLSFVQQVFFAFLLEDFFLLLHSREECFVIDIPFQETAQELVSELSVEVECVEKDVIGPFFLKSLDGFQRKPDGEEIFFLGDRYSNSLACPVFVDGMKDFSRERPGSVGNGFELNTEILASV